MTNDQLAVEQLADGIDERIERINEADSDWKRAAAKAGAFMDLVQMRFHSMKEDYRIGVPLEDVISAERCIKQHIQVCLEDGMPTPSPEQLEYCKVTHFGGVMKFEMWLDS
jgi:hypothetical protein